jgi:hypothetical protein
MKTYTNRCEHLQHNSLNVYRKETNKQTNKERVKNRRHSTILRLVFGAFEINK